MVYVLKRSGEKQEVSFDAILERIKDLSKGLDRNFIDPAEVTRTTIDGLYDGIKTTELDELAAQICAAKATFHPDFSVLASRIAVSNMHKETSESFLDVVKELHAYVEPKTGKHSPFVSEELLALANKYSDRIDNELDHDQDYEAFDYFGIKTLERGYLLSLPGKKTERPQHMFMRVALGIHGEDIDAAFETYRHMSQKDFIHATPTLFNAGTPLPQMSSCFLLAMSEDSIPGIYKTLTDAALISQSAGGLGINIHNIRAEGSFIAGSRGFSNGIVPLLRNFNETARYVDQGGGKRKGAFCIYLEPWHADVQSFLELRKNHGAEERRCRDLFTALWIPDLFMQRVEDDQDWSLFCPKEAPGLHEVYGKKFEELYAKYESEGRAMKVVKARHLWSQIVNSQIETGNPFILFKDSANRKSNQKNLGTIRSSNLCTEIIEYSDKDETAVCNLASIALSKFTKDGAFDFKRLHDVSGVVTRNLNKVIDRNHYILPECKRSNLRHRPMGIGVQGLADVFAMLKLDFDSLEARELNKHIFETIYHGAIEASIELAKKEGAYETFKGSPASNGEFQFNMWNVIPDSGLWDWENTRQNMMKYGLRNSLFLAPMPTATTAQILSNNESIEPFSSNLYVRRVLSGEFVYLNKHLLRDLIALGIWDDSLKKELIAAKGSVQNIEKIPADIKMRYRTVWEIPQRSVIDMAADRGAYICQSQSLNIHLSNATASKLNSIHFHSWKKGLKTGSYYIRNTASRDAVQFTVDNTKKIAKKSEKSPSNKEGIKIHQSSDEDSCFSCGS